MDSDVLAILWSQLDEAKERYRKAKEQRREAIGNADQSAIPTGLPNPDGSLFIRKTLAEDSLARREYFEAMTRLNRYLIDRVVPDDVSEALARKSKSAGRQ